jgi:adenylate cyclase
MSVRSALQWVRRAKRVIIAILLVILACAAGEVTTRIGWLDVLEHTYYDLWHVLAGPRVEPRHVAIVAIDDTTLLEHRDEPLAFWGRHYADAMEVLRKAGAVIIGFDIALHVSAESWLKKLDLPGSDTSRTYDISMRKQLASGQVVLTGTVAGIDQGKGQLILPLDEHLFVLPRGLADVGLTNFFPDADGVIRHFVPALFDDGTPPSLTFATLLSVRAEGLETNSPRWSFEKCEVSNAPIPHRIGFVGPPGTVPRISFSRLLDPQAQADLEIRKLKDKVVIIGADNMANQDMHLTPYAQRFLSMGGRLMSGPEIHANIVETILTGEFPRLVPSWIRILYIIVVLTAGVILFFRLSPWGGLGIGLLFGLVCAFLAFLLFGISWILPVTNVHLALVLAYLGTLGFRLTGEERERVRLRKMFGRYVSDEVVEKLLSTARRPDLGGEALQVTVLFSDIRNFTTISERLSAHEVVEMLNNYLSRACEPILEQGGTVDKFIGDAVMALFGSPVPYADHARRALAAAIQVVETARTFRNWMHQRFPNRNLPEFDIGIGLHTGEAVIGNIGSPKRLEFTAIGDTVNIASRLEGLAKEFGWTIVVSAETIAAAGPGVKTRQRQRVTVKGREEEVEVFEVVGFAPENGGQL